MNVKEKIKEIKHQITRQNSCFIRLIKEVKEFCFEFDCYDYEEIDNNRFDIKYKGVRFITVRKQPHTYEFIDIITALKCNYKLLDVEKALESMLADHYCRQKFS